MARGIKVTGVKKVQNSLLTVQKAFTGPAMDGIARESLTPLVVQTTANALRLRQPGKKPKGGHLDEGIKAALQKPSSGKRRTWWVAFTKRARKIAHLVEFGTAPHEQPRRKIMHPGARPKPFFRTAFEQTKGDVLDRIRIEAAAALGRYVGGRVK